MNNLFLIIALLSATIVNGQTKIMEPEFTNTIVWVNDSIGSGISLETQTATEVKSANAGAYVPFAGFALGKNISKYAVPGSRSTVIVPTKESNRVQFIVRLKDNSSNPTAVISVFKLTVNKDSRFVSLTSTNAFSNKSITEIISLPFTGKRYGENSYIIELSNLLEGEYAVNFDGQREIFNLFSIH